MRKQRARRGTTVGALVLVLPLLLTACERDNPALAAVKRDPARLRGQSGAEITALLGPPGFRREDGTARVWQYAGTRCRLDLFLYEDARFGRKRLIVAHFEFRNRGTAAISGAACLDEIAGQRADGG